MSVFAEFPHERRAQRASLTALTVSIVLGFILAGFGTGRIDLGVPLPALLLIASFLVGTTAVLRRVVWLALVAAGLSVAGVAMGKSSLDGLGLAGLALGYAVATLAFGELTHVTQRYEKAHKVVENEHVSEESLNRVTSETLKTLATRGLLSALAVTLGIALTWILRFAGPRQWRAALETTSALGVALATLALFAAASLFILARGAKLRAEESSPRSSKTAEVDTNVAE